MNSKSFIEEFTSKSKNKSIKVLIELFIKMEGDWVKNNNNYTYLIFDKTKKNQ